MDGAGRRHRPRGVAARGAAARADRGGGPRAAAGRRAAEVWHRPVVGADVAAGWDGQIDDFFLVRTAAFEPRGAFTDEQLRAEGMGATRWWTQAELEAAADTVFAPRDLPARLVALLRDGPPAAPLLVGW